MNRLDTNIALSISKNLLTASEQQLITAKNPSTSPPALENAIAQHQSCELSLLKAMAHTLPWTPTKTIAKQNPTLAQLAAVELIGPNGLVASDALRLGLLLQPAHTHYPKHRHAAEELYLVLSGIASWGQGSLPPSVQEPGNFIYHKSWEWHEMKTSNQPLLALWCWLGDLRIDQYEINNYQ